MGTTGTMEAPAKDGRHLRSQHTRAALLAAAAEVFADQGYGGARLSVISKSAGANVAAISYHFGGKRALYDAVLAASGERFNRLFDTLVEDGPALDLGGIMARLWYRFRAESVHMRIVLRAIIDDGHPPETVVWMRRERLPAAVAPISAQLGVKPEALRMLAISMNLLATRFAVVDDAELCALTGVDTVDEANRIVADHLTVLVQRFLEGELRAGG